MSDVFEVETYTKYKRPKPDPEVNSGEQITETAGYIPADVQITDMIQAGFRLGEYRREMYDFGAEEEVPDDMEPLPYGSDIQTVEAKAMEVEARLQEAQALLLKAEEEKKALEAAKAE